MGYDTATDTHERFFYQFQLNIYNVCGCVWSTPFWAHFSQIVQPDSEDVVLNEPTRTRRRLQDERLRVTVGRIFVSLHEDDPPAPPEEQEWIIGALKKTS